MKNNSPLLIIMAMLVNQASGEGRESGDICAFIEAVESDVNPLEIVCSTNAVCQVSINSCLSLIDDT